MFGLLEVRSSGFFQGSKSGFGGAIKCSGGSEFDFGKDSVQVQSNVIPEHCTTFGRFEEIF